MSAAIIADNTTIKNTTMPRGTVTTNGSQQTLFQTPANTNYKINYLIFSVAPTINRPVIIFDNSAAPEINQLSIAAIATDTFIKFDPPLEFSAGQGLRLNGNAVGLFNANWTAIGTAKVNTP
jgi:hypothetical protein